jgi:hypothetical protein
MVIRIRLGLLAGLARVSRVAVGRLKSGVAVVVAAKTCLFDCHIFLSNGLALGAGSVNRLPRRGVSFRHVH